MPKYEMSRGDYARVADEIMHYVTKEFGMDKITALPFVSNIASAVHPTIEKIVNEQLEKQKNETT